MAITYNRKPVGVSIPSNSDVGQSYFNHFNWKGINQNRNFLVVDQETFADANNVYVDDEGLLKSRLPVKFRYKFEGKYLKDVKVFDNILVCTYIENDEWYIGIIDDDQFINNIKVITDYSLKAFKNGNYIYIFTNDGCKTYDVDAKTMADTLFYEPITRVYTGLNFDFYESENLMSKSNRYQYLLYPTIGSSDEDNKYISNSINANVYGKVGNYVHYLNEEKINHEVILDADKRFLNVVHQPLFSDTNGFYTESYFRGEVPAWVIRDEMFYRYNDYKIQTCSLSDGVFVDLYNIKTNYPSLVEDLKFIKIKLTRANNIYVLTNKGSFKIGIDNEITFEGRSSLGILCDIDECVYNGELIETLLYFKDREDGSVPVGAMTIIVPHITYKIEGNDKVIRAGVRLNSGAPEFVDIHLRTDVVIDDNLGVFVTYCSTLSSDFVYINLIEFNIMDNGTYVVGSACGQVSGSVESDINIQHNPTYPQIGLSPQIKLISSGRSLEVCYYDGISNKICYGVMRYPTYTGSNWGLWSDVKFKFENEYYPQTPYSNYLYQYCGGLFIQTEESLKYLYGDVQDLVTTLNGKIFVNEDYWMLHLNDRSLTMSNYRLKTQPINVRIDKAEHLYDFDVMIKRDKFYASKNNNFYIGEIIIDPDDDKEKLYFKKDYEHILDEQITGLHPISDTELAIFTNNDIWYNTNVDGIQYYVQSKIVPSLKNKSSLITLPDSTTTLMPSNDGMVALSYQNFVNTTEQSTVNLTQDLMQIYNLFNENIRSLNWKQYTMFYESNNDLILIYDNRLASWWRWTLPITISTLFIYDNLLYCIADGCIYEFSNSFNDYYDKLENDSKKIDWYIESQKLFLGANNNYKHISNITLFSVQEGGNNDKLSLELNVKNYRKNVNNGKSEDFGYKIDVIRTYVKRVNYAKVCEFQYKLGSNSQSHVELDIPLALSNVSIKYKIGGQVR